MTIETIKRGAREDWLALRKTGLGGSDAGAVVGVNPYKSAVDVWLEKTGRAAPFEGNDATYWGNMLEDLVAREYGRREGVAVRNYGYTVRDGCLIGNVDRLVQTGDGLPAFKAEVRTDRALECKTAREVWPDGLPASYEAQVQHYMGLFPTIQRMDVAVFFMARRRFDVFTVCRDDEVIAALQAAEREFWEKYVVGGEMPPPVSESDCRKLWASSRGERVVGKSEAIAALDELADIAAARAAQEEREAELRAVVMASMGEADTLVDGSGKVLATWKQSKDRTKTDWKAVAAEAGASDEIIGKHTATAAGARVFLNKVRREK